MNKKKSFLIFQYHHVKKKKKKKKKLYLYNKYILFISMKNKLIELNI